MSNIPGLNPSQPATPIQQTSPQPLQRPRSNSAPTQLSSPKSFASGTKAPVLSGPEMQTQVSAKIDQTSSEQITKKAAFVPQPQMLKEMKARIMQPETQAMLKTIDQGNRAKVLDPLKQDHQRLQSETHDDGAVQADSNPLAGLKTENKIPTMMKMFAGISDKMDNSLFKSKSLDQAEQLGKQLMGGSISYIGDEVIKTSDLKLMLATRTEADVKNDLATGMGLIKNKYQGTTNYSQLSANKQALVDRIYKGMKSGAQGQEQQIIAQKTAAVSQQIGEAFKAPNGPKAIEFVLRDKNENMLYVAEQMGLLSEENLTLSKNNVNIFSDQILPQLPASTQQILNAAYAKISDSLQASGGQISDVSVKLTDKNGVQHDAPKDFSLNGKTFQATAFLGQGGFGKVFEYTSTGQPAEKLVIKEMLADDDMGRLDISQEIRAHAHLMGPEGKGSPHIVNLQGVLKGSEGKFFMVMDKAETDLEKGLEKLHDNGLNQLDSRQKNLLARFVAREAMESLKYVQTDMNTQHMDIKPANMLIGPEGQIVVADFGSSVTNHEVWDGKRKEDGAKVGLTPTYEAPESSAKNRQLSQKYDTWSIGVMMHNIVGADFNKGQALAGQARQTSDSQKNLTGFDIIVNQLNHPDPSQRPTLSAALAHSYFQDPELNTPELKQLWQALISGNQAEVTRLKDAI